MVDRATFRRLNANYQFPTAVPSKVENTVAQNNPRFAGSPTYDVYGNLLPVPIPTPHGKINTSRCAAPHSHELYRYFCSNCVRG